MQCSPENTCVEVSSGKNKNTLALVLIFAILELPLNQLELVKTRLVLVRILIALHLLIKFETQKYYQNEPKLNVFIQVIIYPK